MEAHLALIPEEEGSPYGTVNPVVADNGGITYGLSVGNWTLSSESGNGYIHIVLPADVETIVHEVATRKSVRAESRATEKALKGEEKKPTIEYDPVTRKFKQV